MIDDFKQDAASRMAKTITALKATMAKIFVIKANTTDFHLKRPRGTKQFLTKVHPEQEAGTLQ